MSFNVQASRLFLWHAGKPPTGAAPAGGAASFTVSSFNVLGSSHTRNSDRYESGVARMDGVRDLLRKQGVEVVGFQELNADQARVFKQDTKGEWGLYAPGPMKSALGTHNSLAWKKDTWELVEGRTVTFPSHMGRPQPTPVVRLRHKATGRECWFMNVHNAPGYHIGQQQATRDRALALQADMIERLQRETGLPVILTGDMNDKARYRDGIAQQADMHAANDPKGPKPAPARFVDWIFGSAEVAFSHWRRDASSVQRRISDHGMLAAEVRLG